MPVESTLTELKAEVYYVATLRHGADEVELEVEEVRELNLTGEGEVPLTTRLGDLSLSVIVTSRLLEVLNRVTNYRDVSIELVDVTNSRCLFAGVGDRAGWSTDITDASRTADLAFVSKLAAQDPTDVHDAGTSRAYDTLSWARALDKVADMADVFVSGSLEDLELDNVSICRRVTSRLAGADYAVGERVGGLAVIPTGVAVGVGRYVMWTNGTAYLPLAKIWYKNTGHDFDAEVAAGGWVIVALGYRGGSLHGLVGLPNRGIVARFSCSAAAAKYGVWPAVKIEGANCFRWWFDLCAVRGVYTKWRVYGGTETAMWNLYSVGWPAPTSTKELGVPKPDGRLAGATVIVSPKGACYVGVVNPGPLTRVRVGDVIEIEKEFGGKVTRLERTGGQLIIFFDRELAMAHPTGSDVCVYKQETLPANNILLSRPVPVLIHYYNPEQWGGDKVVDVKALRRRYLDSAGSRFYSPIAVDDVDGEVVGPGYVALQAETDLLSYEAKISYSPIPRNFDAYFPGRCIFPPDVANHVEYRQTRTGRGINSDQGPVRVYEDGSALGNNEADGAVVTVRRNGKTWVMWEDLDWREKDNTRLPVLKIGYVNSAGKIIRTWRNREPADPHAGPEYYISSPLVVRDGKIYGALRVRDRVWKDIDASVIAVGPDEATEYESGSLPLMFDADLGNLVKTGDEVRVGSQEPAVYTVAEVSTRWQIFYGISAEHHACDELGAYNGPATVLGLSEVDGIFSGGFGDWWLREKVKARFCGQTLKLATSSREYWAVFEFDPAGLTFVIKNELIYNPGEPKIDEEAAFTRDLVLGEALAPEDGGPVGWALYKAANKNPVDETSVVVWANRRLLEVVDVTDDLSLPAPEEGKAYINYRAGDDANELWLYLSDRYLDADVVVRYDYYSDVPITAVWPWNGDFYFGSGDGYIWRLDGTARACIGRFPDGDYPIETVVDDDTTWLLTAAGRLAKHDRYHSGCVEGDFGGDDQDLFHLVAEIARASGTPVRETPDGLQLGGTETVNLEEHDVVRVGERPARDVRALEVEYSDGIVVAGNAKAKAEQTARLPTALIYTPQHAKAVAEFAWTRLAAARRRVVLEGVSADPMVVALATSATYFNSVYEILRLGILQNDYRIEARDVTPFIETPTLPKTEAD